MVFTQRPEVAFELSNKFPSDTSVWSALDCRIGYTQRSRAAADTRAASARAHQAALSTKDPAYRSKKTDVLQQSTELHLAFKVFSVLRQSSHRSHLCKTGPSGPRIFSKCSLSLSVIGGYKGGTWSRTSPYQGPTCFQGLLVFLEPFKFVTLFIRLPTSARQQTMCVQVNVHTAVQSKKPVKETQRTTEKNYAIIHGSAGRRP